MGNTLTAFTAGLTVNLVKNSRNMYGMIVANRNALLTLNTGCLINLITYGSNVNGRMTATRNAFSAFDTGFGFDKIAASFGKINGVVITIFKTFAAANTFFGSDMVKTVGFYRFFAGLQQTSE